MTTEPATNPAPTPAETPAPAQEVASTPADDTPIATEGEQPEGQAAPAEEFEEIEREGKKATIPKWLKSELMMQQDYTRKTQEVAEQRRQAEAAAAAVQAERQAWQTYQQEAGQYYALDAQVKDYAKLSQDQWDQWANQNPIEANNAWRRFSALKEQQREIGAKLAQKDAETRAATERDFATRYEQVNSEMAKRVPTWNAEASKVGQYLTKQGFGPADVKLIASHLGATEMARKAYLYDQLQAKHRAAQTPAPAPVATPAPVGGQRTVSTDLRTLASRKDPSDFISMRNKAERRPR
jgi:hypothetical protein